jgi:hypothetical protein
MRFLNLEMYFPKTGTSSTHRGRQFHEPQTKKGKDIEAITSNTLRSVHRASASIDIPPKASESSKRERRNKGAGVTRQQNAG